MIEEVTTEEYVSPEVMTVMLASPVCVNQQSITLGSKGTTENMEEEDLVW